MLYYLTDNRGMGELGESLEEIAPEVLAENPWARERILDSVGMTDNCRRMPTCEGGPWGTRRSQQKHGTQESCAPLGRVPW